jgi:hypothetical protein
MDAWNQHSSLRESEFVHRLRSLTASSQGRYVDCRLVTAMRIRVVHQLVGEISCHTHRVRVTISSHQLSRAAAWVLCSMFVLTTQPQQPPQGRKPTPCLPNAHAHPTTQAVTTAIREGLCQPSKPQLSHTAATPTYEIRSLMHSMMGLSVDSLPDFSYSNSVNRQAGCTAFLSADTPCDAHSSTVHLCCASKGPPSS